MTLKDLLDHPAVRGVAIGACVDGRSWDPTDHGHAHCQGRLPVSQRYVGWICFEHLSSITSARMLEELAHLVAKTDGVHDATYRRTRLELLRIYRKRPTTGGK